MLVLLAFHIAAGTVSLGAGAASLALRKGGKPHRISGRIFAVAMLVMSSTSVYLALVRNEPDNVIAGSLTCYLVVSAWMVIRRPRTWSWDDTVALCAVLAIAFAGAAFGIEAASSANGMKGGVAASDLFFLAGIAGSFAVSDLVRRFRGPLSNKQRMGRHVWRMCFAMFIATLSLFFGQAQIFPDVVRATYIHLAPVLLVAGLTVYWLLRVRFFGWRLEARKRLGKSNGGSPGDSSNGSMIG